MTQVPGEMPQQPQLRIGDAERDAAVARLQTALGEGRLTTAEFDERVGIALQARTQRDLDPLFRDLPPADADPRALSVPGSASGSSVAPAGSGGLSRRGWIWALQGAMWPLVLLIMAATDWEAWWLVFVPLVLGPVLFGNARSKQPSRQRDERRAELRDESRQLRERRRELRDERRELR